MQQISSVSRKTPQWKEKKTLSTQNSIHFLQCFCVGNKKKSKGNKVTPKPHLPNICCGTSPATILTLIEIDNAYPKHEFQDMCGSKHTLGGPINYRTLNSSSKTAELKFALMHQCKTFSVSRIFHHFLLSAQTGFTRSHNALTNKIGSHIIIH